MAEQAVDDRTKPDKPERACAWCGKQFQAGKHNAKFCGPKCKDTHRRRSNGVVPFRREGACEVCGVAFIAKTATRKYCGAECRCAAQIASYRETNTANARRYRSENPERYRVYDRSRWERDREGMRAKAREGYRRMKETRPEAYRDMLAGQRARERARNASTAISALLLPAAPHFED